jgi:hypothetical protein
MQLGLSTSRTQARTRVFAARALTVTLGLSGAGAIIGATIAMGSYFAFIVGLRWEGYSGPLPFPSLSVPVGAALGAIALPLAAWTLPRASLGRIIATTGVAAALGIPIGLQFSVNLFGGVLGALVGLACAVRWIAICRRGASAATTHRL